ncbi:MAG: histidine kinase [Chloroflexota bacterium]
MKLSVGLKLVLMQFAVTVGMMLVLESLGWIFFPQAFPVSQRAPHTWEWIIGAAASSLILWAVARLGVLRRLGRALAISQDWLRGNLALRIADGSKDELGRLTAQMDRLAQQLAQDEQDLAELRRREARLGDQVRALSIVDERNRLARELHDGVKQHLFSLAMTASALQDRAQAQPACMPEAMAEIVVQLKTTAQTAQHEMTRLIEGLRPASIQERGLAAALNDYTLLFGAREHLLIYLDVQGNDALLPLSVAETFYLIAQEALHNVIRHARATRVDMKLQCLPEEACLIVRDNGAGFDQNQPHHGLGVSNMHERLLSVGGRLSIESFPGRGTTVIARAGVAHPLPAEHEYARPDQKRPRPVIENWAWLGRRLVIPVGQIWPWSPADEVYLRQPLLHPDWPVAVHLRAGFLGLGKGLRWQFDSTSLRIQYTWHGFAWRFQGANWSLQNLEGPNGPQVLFRNGQALAAVQYQGRQMDVWSEFVYAGRGYRLCPQDAANAYLLTDEAGEPLLDLLLDGKTMRAVLSRPLPVMLVLTTVLRFGCEKKIVQL